MLGIVNYENGRWEEIRRILKNCLNTLEMQKNLFQPVAFSMAAGAAADDCAGDPGLSERSAAAHLGAPDQRDGKVFRKAVAAVCSCGEKSAGRISADATRAVEVLSPQLAEKGADRLLQEMRDRARGSRLRDQRACFSAADVFAARVSPHNRNTSLENFRRQCESLSTAEQLFDCLKLFQKEHLEELIDSHENETVRPVRKAKQYIQNHFSEQITLEEVSDAVA